MKEQKISRKNSGKTMQLSTRMSLTLGLFSILILVIFGYTMIHLSKQFISKSIDGNMTDKAYMAFNDVDNIIVKADILAKAFGTESARRMKGQVPERVKCGIS